MRVQIKHGEFVMTALPIDSVKSQFETKILHSHLVVEAETGSGKSTRLPLWASEHGRVLVIEPRRIACTSLAQYLAQQSGSALGVQVGYAIKLKAVFEKNTPIVFVTPGVALRWFAEDGLKSFDIVLIDEFHERRWDMDLLTAMLKVRGEHRLIVTSATMAGDRLVSYLAAQRIVSHGRCFPVEVQHLAQESRQLPQKKFLERSVVETIGNELTRGGEDILVFLPGRKEIAQVVQALRAFTDIMVVTLHASVSDEERQRALTVQPLRKVVLATNVAETSLTIPNITCVIDSGLERRNVQRNGRTALVLSTISKASAAQRAGRAGRVMAGRCVRLFGEHAPMELATPPELQREELTEPMLAAACCGYQLAELPFLDPLPEKSLAQASEVLRTMQAIDQFGRVTEHGKILNPLPIDTLYADLVTRMPSKALKEAMIDLAAALSVPANLYQLAGGEQAQELDAAEPNLCDVTLLIGLVRGKRYPGVNIDEQALTEAMGLAEQMRALFELPELEVASRYQREALAKAIATLHPELLFVRRAKRQEALGNGQMEMLVGKQSRFGDKAQAAVVLDSHSLPGRGVKQTLNLASVMMPVALTLIDELDLGEWRQGESRLQTEQGQVLTERIFAGRVVASKLVQPQGESAIQAIIAQVKSGQLLDGFYTERHQQIEHWKLFCALGLNDDNSVHSKEVSFDVWFAEQLEALGVNTLEEMALFDAADFPFAGIPDWQYADFAQHYPLSLTLSDLQLQVEYFPARKLVQVVHCGGNRKEDPKRWELPRLSGWKVQYRKASRIVDVR